ncbi:MAG: TonB-dependent receptor, partial [Pseudomonadota bacterium]
GNEFPDAPKFTAAFGGTYTFDQGWFLSADASYTASAFTDVGNTPALKSDARFLVNARAGYRGENFEVFGYARNLLDEEYTTSAASLSTFVGPPREFGFFVDATF